MWGFIGKPTKKTFQALYLLGTFNEERGKDSTGLVISNGKEFSFHKNMVKAKDFLKDPKTVQLLNKYKKEDFINVIGHTRQVTRGIISKTNAHPFRIGRFILAHNGVVYNFDELQEKYKTDYSVDSQMIGYLLNIFEPIEVFEKQIGGWFTVPFFELEKQTELNIVKHSAPLSLTVLPDGSGMYYSSLKADLKKALLATGIRAGIGETNGSKLYTYKWENGKLLRNKFKIYNNVNCIPNYLSNNYGEFGYEKGYKYNYKPEKKKETKLLPVCSILKERKKKLTKYTVSDNGLIKHFYAC